MDSSHQKQGCCSSCGFLPKFDFHFDGPPPYIYEMPPKDRETGEVSPIRLEAGRQINCFPQCYVNATDIWEKISAVRQKAGHSNFGAVQQFLGEDRQCPKWYSYTPGFSPQQHLEKIQILELELRRQEFEQRMDRENKEFTDRLDQRNRRFQVRLAIILGIFALAAVFAAFVQVAFPNGWPWLMHQIGADIKPTIPPLPGF